MKKGRVALVGAGPGDRGLLTVKGEKQITQAEVVVYDRLVSDDILALIPENAEKIDVGKQSSNHTVPQYEINRILLEKALAGKNVVRLKGGDPFLFGRGGEELELLAQNNIEFEVIPGITSAIAVPAYAGIPVTHRDFCSSLHIITGHAKEGKEVDINFEAITKLQGSFVFLMGVSSLGFIMNGLLDAGMRPDMPAAIIENGTRPSQRKVVSTISELTQQSEKEQIHSPAVIIVGEVCSLSNQFDFFAKKSLFGKKIIVTRAADAAGTLSERLRAEGAQVIEYPCIKILEITENKTLDNAIKNLKQNSWLCFTSKNGVEIFFKRLKNARLDSRALSGVRIAAIGSQTAAEIEKYGITADFIPASYDSKSLSLGLCDIVNNGEKILVCRAAQGTPELCEIFKINNIEFDDIAVYDTVYTNELNAELRQQILNKEIDYVTFTSASTVEGFVKSIGEIDYSALNSVCIGEKTAAAAEKYKIPHIISNKATIESMTEKLKEVIAGDR